MKREDWPVTEENGPRPAGKPDECFYCLQKLGEQHAAACVLRKRTVVVELTIQYVVDVPETWTPENIEFHRNESSWCANNALGELASLATFMQTSDRPCVCERASTRFVREATLEDEANNNVFVDELPKEIGMKTKKLLQNVRELLSDPKHWIQQEEACDKNDMPVDPASVHATCWCLIGAIHRYVPDDDGSFVVRSALQRISKACLVEFPNHYEGKDPISVITLFNDMIATHSDVLKVLDHAIQRCR